MSSNQDVAHYLDNDFYKRIFQLSPEAIVIIDKTGHIIQVNDRLQEWLGYTPDEILHKHLLQLPFLSLKTREEVVKNFLQRLAGKEIGEYKTEFLSKSQELKIGTVRGSLIKDQSGQTIADLVMITESTKEHFESLARKKKEKILEAVSYSAKYFLKSKASQQDFEKVLESIGQSVQAHRVILVINDLLNQRYEWVLPGTVAVIQSPEFPNFFLQKKQFETITSQLEQNKPVAEKTASLEQSLQSPLNDIGVLSSIIVPIIVEEKLWAYLWVHDCKDARGWMDEEIDSLVIAAEIIGAAIEKNHVEIKLRETVEYWKHEKDRVSEEIENTKKFKQAVDSATDGVVITSVDSKIIYVNPAWEKMTGYSFKEVEGMNPKILNQNKTPPNIFTSMWQELEKGFSFETEEVINTRKDGREFPTRLTVFPIQENHQNKFFVGLIEDITKRKEIDQMRTEFISIASHQLNTPLSAMKWFLELLLNGKAGELTPKQLEFVHNIADSNLRMIALVRSLLNVSRIESGRIIVDPQPTDLLALIQDVLKDIDLLVKKKNQTVTVTVDPSIQKVVVDQRLIRHVYMNLLTNASKYSPENKSIEVTVEKKDQNFISHIKDYGYGIPKEDQEKIFTKFFRAPNVVRMEADGSGLGMYLVKIVIESSGGKVWFVSEENKGTQVSFSLPIAGIAPKVGEVFLAQNKIS